MTAVPTSSHDFAAAQLCLAHIGLCSHSVLLHKGLIRAQLHEMRTQELDLQPYQRILATMSNLCSTLRELLEHEETVAAARHNQEPVGQKRARTHDDIVGVAGQRPFERREECQPLLEAGGSAWHRVLSDGDLVQHVMSMLAGPSRASRADVGQLSLVCRLWRDGGTREARWRPNAMELVPVIQQRPGRDVRMGRMAACNQGCGKEWPECLHCQCPKPHKGTGVCKRQIITSAPAKCVRPDCGAEDYRHCQCPKQHEHGSYYGLRRSRKNGRCKHCRVKGDSPCLGQKQHAQAVTAAQRDYNETHAEANVTKGMDPQWPSQPPELTQHSSREPREQQMQVDAAYHVERPVACDMAAGSTSSGGRYWHVNEDATAPWPPSAVYSCPPQHVDSSPSSVFSAPGRMAGEDLQRPSQLSELSPHSSRQPREEHMQIDAAYHGESPQWPPQVQEEPRLPLDSARESIEKPIHDDAASNRPAGGLASARWSNLTASNLEEVGIGREANGNGVRQSKTGGVDLAADARSVVGNAVESGAGRKPSDGSSVLTCKRAASGHEEATEDARASVGAVEQSLMGGLNCNAHEERAIDDTRGLAKPPAASAYRTIEGGVRAPVGKVPQNALDLWRVRDPDKPLLPLGNSVSRADGPEGLTRLPSPFKHVETFRCTRDGVRDVSIDFTNWDKDLVGSSGGVLMALSMLSTMTDCSFDLRTAITGELTLSGKVHKVGDIDLKVTKRDMPWAHSVIIPLENAAEVEELREREGKYEVMRTHCVSDMNEILREIVLLRKDGILLKSYREPQGPLFVPEPTHDLAVVPVLNLSEACELFEVEVAVYPGADATFYSGNFPHSPAVDQGLLRAYGWVRAHAESIVDFLRQPRMNLGDVKMLVDYAWAATPRTIHPPERRWLMAPFDGAASAFTTTSRGQPYGRSWKWWDGPRLWGSCR